MSSNISGACCKGETGYDLEDSTVPKPQSHTGAISETDSPAKARKQNFPTDDLESNVSSETEGPDTHSYLSGSSDTEGPDTDHSFSEDAFVIHDKSRRGMVIKQGSVISFVADNLNEQVKLSSPSQSGTSRSSRRSSLDSDIWDQSSSQILATVEKEAAMLSQSVDQMLKNVQSNLHMMSAITVGCMQTYKGSVQRTLHEVDSNIKLMYTFMARCEELNHNAKMLYAVADQIYEIKKILDKFEDSFQISG